MDVDRRPNLLQRFKIFLLTRSLGFLLFCTIIVSVVLGLSIVVSKKPLSKRQAEYLAFPGDVLIRLLRCSTTPLIISCIVVALGTLDLSHYKRMCWQLCALAAISLSLSATIAMSSVIMLHPGRPMDEAYIPPEDFEKGRVAVMDIFFDMFRNIMTSNMIRMYMQLHETVLTEPEGNETETNIMKWKIGKKYSDNMNLLGMVLVGALCGLTLAVLPDKGRGLYVIAESIYEVSMKLAIWILWICPVFIFVVILSQTLTLENLALFTKRWGRYILTVYTGYIAIFLLEYPMLVLLLTGQNPFKLYKDISSALMTAFATSSSYASMPIVLDSLLKHDLEPRLVRFLVPITLNLHKAGAVNFLVCSTVFVAQESEVTLDVHAYMNIMTLATLGSIAVPGVPSGALFLLLIIVSGLGFNQELVVGVFFIDWIIDRGETVINVLGNCSLTKIIAEWNLDYIRPPQYIRQ